MELVQMSLIKELLYCVYCASSCRTVELYKSEESSAERLSRFVFDQQSRQSQRSAAASPGEPEDQEDARRRQLPADTQAAGTGDVASEYLARAVRESLRPGPA